jgi:hypothetical protein
MDKKEKKRLEVLQQKIAKLQQLLTGAKKQPDDPAEVPRLEKELAVAHAELAALKKAYDSKEFQDFMAAHQKKFRLKT